MDDIINGIAPIPNNLSKINSGEIQFNKKKVKHNEDN